MRPARRRSWVIVSCRKRSPVNRVAGRDRDVINLPIRRRQRLREVIAESACLLRRPPPGGEDDISRYGLEPVIGKDFYECPRGEFFCTSPCRGDRNSET